MSDCATCNDPLPGPNECAKCSVYDLYFHFECADILESTWNRMGQARRDSWRCKSCNVKAKIPKDLINQMHTDFLQKMETTIREQFSSYEKKFSEKMSEFSESMNFFSAKIDEYEKKISEFVGKVKSLEKSHSELSAENSLLKKEISECKIQLLQLEQYNRNRNVQIDGVPEQPNEKMCDIVQTLSNSVGVPIDFERDVQAIHRIPTKQVWIKSGEEVKYQLPGYDLILQDRLDKSGPVGSAFTGLATSAAPPGLIFLSTAGDE
ncbi:hypothetical protein J6590_001374 [Homalodisca vitripennis]|nr:hypothetical protein J6590_001374 [Homalodisca vitripennis]